MRVFRIVARSLSAGLLLTALAACGGASSRSSRNGSPAYDGSAARAETSPQSINAKRPESGKARPFRGRIIPLSDSMLVHGRSDTLRFGHLGSGEIAIQRFRLENRTAKPIVILSTSRSCGCISLNHDSQPIAPGQSRTLEMTFDSRGEYGWQLKRMDIILSGSAKPLRLFIEADIE